MIRYYKPKEINSKYGLRSEDILLPTINKEVLTAMKEAVSDLWPKIV
jgi:hypothetical protein